MSRIGKKPVAVPAGVKVTVKPGSELPGSVVMEGPKGKLTLPVHPKIKVTWTESEKSLACTIDPADAEDRQVRASWGSTRAHLANMVVGVTKGYERGLQVVGTGWTASVTGKNLKLVCGFANPIFLAIPEGLKITVDKATGEVTPIKVEGIDLQLVGQFASKIRSQKKPEPYQGKGIRYSNEVVKRKEGKQFGS
ncbi:MAG: 50S ribosomal protein L6 [Planctomycetota bacterium]|nr:50S ribosomal protein L6 [Planctomycetota bacterium]